MEEVVSILVYAFIGLFFYAILKGVANYILHAEVRSHVRDVLAEMVHDVRVETHGTMQYWFDSDSDMFLGQGTTEDEVIEHVKARFPTHIFIIPDRGFVSRPDWTIKTDTQIAEITKIVTIDKP